MTDRQLGQAGHALLDAFVPPLRLTGPDTLDFVVSQESPVDGVAVTLTDPSTQQHHFMHISANLSAMVGFRVEELLGRPFPMLFGDKLPLDEMKAVDAALADGGQYECALTLRHANGSSVAVHTTFAPLPSLHRQARYRLLLFRDLSQQTSERLLADQSLVVDSLARGQDLGSLCHQVATHIESRLIDSGRCWIGVSALDERLEAVVTGDHDLDLVGEVLRLVMGAGEPTNPRCVLVANLPERLAAPLLGSGVQALWAFPTLDSEAKPVGALVVAHIAEDIPTDEEVRFLDHLSHVVASAVERAAVETSLAHRVLHDPLTNLPNRVLIVDRLEQALGRLTREPSVLSVLLVDIDRFKAINDSWGSEVGDLVLTEVGKRLLATVRSGDTVGRVSSDQFLMICVAGGEVDAAAVARRVLRTLEEPIAVGDEKELRVTASIGVVVVDDGSQTPAAVIGNAESAVSRAIKSGRSRFALFDERLQYEAVTRQDIEQALHDAIRRRELVLHYQPVCEVATGRMVGAEALIRWDRPGHGLLAPGQFIDVAEESGIIVELGAWVIEQVAADLGRWPRVSGRAPVVSVNLSARQLADPSLLPTVRGALERHDLSPVQLSFEVTESMQIHDFEAATDTLDELSDLGCRIAIDDFGIGYATLDYLRRFSVANLLKIDRSFVSGLEDSREDHAIVSASLALASALDLLVVAEGVETLDQIERLNNLGCTYAQGYALSRPVPLDRVLELWESEFLFPPPVIRLDG
ncbi:MAG: EAL domain-containing protein [Actinomycetota bacterium]